MTRHLQLVESRVRRFAAAAAAVSLAGMLAVCLSAQTAERWDAAIQKFEDQDKVSPPPQNGIVFIGASSIVRWNLPEYFPELGAEAINRGFGGSQSVDSVRYVDRIVVPYRPRIVVYYAGDNDVEANVPPAEIARQFELFDQKVHAALPQTEDHLHLDQAKHPPVEMDRHDQVGERDGEGVCAKEKHLAFMDIEQQMLGEDGKPNPDLLVADGLHMTPAGYRIWTAALTPLLKER